MEERKTIFNYIEQTLIIFGVTMCILNVFCVMFGESARDFSTMFALGNEGLSVYTMMQFLLASVCTTALRFLFFTDTFIKNMTVTVRAVCMVIAELAVVSVFIIVFGWFPVDMWQPWAMFFLCFGVCFIVASVVTVVKTRLENEEMEKALKRLKEQQEEH